MEVVAMVLVCEVPTQYSEELLNANANCVKLLE